MSPSRRSVSALAALCLLPAAAMAEDVPAAIASAVDVAVSPLLTTYDVPGIAVGVTVRGERYFFNFGTAGKKKENTPVTQDTLFEIGSVSKTFAATLFSYAEALGKISPEDSPGEYIPELKGSALDKTSLLHLGTYTAGGLPLQFPGSVSNDAEAVNYFRSWKPGAEPGAQRRYSNPSLGLFGHVTARAMGGDFADLMETELFPKLGLKRTWIEVPEAEMENYAWGHDRNGKPVRANAAVFAAQTYGVRTSAADLIRYVEANLRPESLEETMRRAVEATHVGYFRVGPMVQGLGWEQYPFPLPLERLLEGNSREMIWEPNAAERLDPPRTPAGPTLFNKTGSTNGFSAYVAFVPAEDIGIVILANGSVPIPARVTAAHSVLEALTRRD